jgi:broad specificity phosphatase PhoE/ribonuclease HI
VVRRLVVEADGGSRGNPGVAGYGALVRDAESGALLAERAEPLGQASNNVAEYRGLIAGLEAALAIADGPHIEARMDSKLVVEQMSGRWKIKHEDMRRLALEARELVRRCVEAGGRVTFTWIPREENRAADALSNVAMDGETVDRTFGGESTLDDLPGAQAADTQRAVAATPPRPRGPGRGAVTRVVLVRHGVTAFTEEGRLDGRGGADPSLSTTGRAQAAAAGRALAHLLAGQQARVVTSSLARAVETGAIIADATGAPTSIDPDFDEQGFGDWDGVSIAELLKDPDQPFHRMRVDGSYARPGGESRVDLAARVVPAWERLLTEGGTTVLVCHRMVIFVILAHLLGLDDDKAWRLAVAPGSLTAVEAWENGEIQVAFVNRT